MNPTNLWNSVLSQGAGLMLLASLAFIGYAIVFFFRNFAGDGLELGVTTLNGVTPDNLDALNPAIMHYIKHLHLAISGFIAATAIAVGALSWYGVRRGEWWAWIAAVASAVVGLAIALPYHWLGHFEFNWVTHLGPIYVATIIFVIGAILALRAMTTTGQA
jgi:hypothetical protein